MAETFGFESSPIETPVRRFRATHEGFRTRISVLSFDTGTKVGVKATVHWHKNVGFFLCKHGICCTLGKPLKKVGVVIVDYDGVSEKDILGRVPSPEMVKPWIFSGGLWKHLQDIHSTFPLTSYDLYLHCENQKFQRWAIHTVPNRLFESWPELNSIVENRGPVMLKWLKSHIAQDLSMDMIKGKIPELDPAPKTAQVLKPSASPELENILKDFSDEKKRPFRKILLKKRSKDA